MFFNQRKYNIPTNENMQLPLLSCTRFRKAFFALETSETNTFLRVKEALIKIKKVFSSATVS